LIKKIPYVKINLQIKGYQILMCSSNKSVLTEHLYNWELELFLCCMHAPFLHVGKHNKHRAKHPPAISGIKAWI